MTIKAARPRCCHTRGQGLGTDALWRHPNHARIIAQHHAPRHRPRP